MVPQTRCAQPEDALDSLTQASGGAGTESQGSRPVQRAACCLPEIGSCSTEACSKYPAVYTMATEKGGVLNSKEVVFTLEPQCSCVQWER